MSRYTFIGTVSMPAQMGFKAPPPTHLYFERSEHIRTPKIKSMKGKGVDDTKSPMFKATGGLPMLRLDLVRTS